MNRPSISSPVRVAVVGHGGIADVHARAVEEIPCAMLVGVAGREMERVEPFAERHTIEPFVDTSEMVRSVAADIVIVATPHPRHADTTIAAAGAGAHVLVEKPLAITTADCDRIIGASAASGVTVGVVSQRRFLPAVLRMKTAIERGSIGNPILGSVTLFGWRDPDYYRTARWRGTWEGEGGGVLVNQAVHHIDLLQWLMGPFDEVFGYWANLNHPSIEVDDTAVAVLRGSDGRLGSLVVSNSQRPGLHARILVHGANGATLGVQTDGGSMFIAGSSTMEEVPHNHVWTVPGEQDLLASWLKEDEAEFAAHEPLVHYHKLAIRDFISAIRSGTPPAVTAQDGRRTVELFEGIYRSTADGKPIRLGQAS